MHPLLRRSLAVLAPAATGATISACAASPAASPASAGWPEMGLADAPAIERGGSGDAAIRSVTGLMNYQKPGVELVYTKALSGAE